MNICSSLIKFLVKQDWYQIVDYSIIVIDIHYMYAERR